MPYSYRGTSRFGNQFQAFMSGGPLVPSGSLYSAFVPGLVVDWVVGKQDGSEKDEKQQ